MFSNLTSNCSNSLDMGNLQEQVKKVLCYQQLFWAFTVLTSYSSDLKKFSNSQPSALNFKSFSALLEQFFLTVGQNHFGNKIPFFSINVSPFKLFIKSQHYKIPRSKDKFRLPKWFICSLRWGSFVLGFDSVKKWNNLYIW